MKSTAAIFDGFPFIIGWELTVQCNLRCRHCGSSAGLPRRGELTTQEALQICDQFPALLTTEVDFTGGEPLLRPDWPILASRIIDSGIDVSILTNGWRLKAKQVEMMQEVGISAVGISLDGLEETHDYIRNRNGAFTSVMKSIEQIQNAGFTLHVITTVNSQNLVQLPQILELLMVAGVRFWRLQPIIPTGRVHEHADLVLNTAQMYALGNFIRKQRARLDKEQIYIICSDGLQYVIDDDPDEKPWRGCAAGIVSCGITSDGKVKGCLSMPDDLIEGDLRKQDLWDIWFNPDNFSYTRQFNQSNLGDNCNRCEHGLECQGGCSASSYCSTGQFHNDPFCYHRARSVMIDVPQTVPLTHIAGFSNEDSVHRYREFH